jgi:hypothetical protein
LGGSEASSSFNGSILASTLVGAGGATAGGGPAEGSRDCERRRLLSKRGLGASETGSGGSCIPEVDGATVDNGPVTDISPVCDGGTKSGREDSVVAEMQ